MVDIPGAITGTVNPTPAPAPQAQAWHPRGVAYYGLTVIILATLLNFFDAQVFRMMAQGITLGGQLISLAAAWPVSHWMGLTIHGWQWVLMMVGAPGLVISALLLLAREPARRGAVAQGQSLPFKHLLRELRARKGIYL